MKKYSHSNLTKSIVFLIAVICFVGIVQAGMEMKVLNESNFRSITEDNYFESYSYIQESERLIHDLTLLIGEYKDEEHILDGNTIDKEQLEYVEENLYWNFRETSREYDPTLTDEQNYEIFKESFAPEIQQAKDKQIRQDVRHYHQLLQNLETYQEPLFYASDGTITYTNNKNNERESFQNYPAYLIFDRYKQEFHPKETKENDYLSIITDQVNSLNPDNLEIYLAFSEEFLQQKEMEWQKEKEIATINLYQFLGFLIGFIFSFTYLLIVIGRKSFGDKEVHIVVDMLYNDLKLLALILLFPCWIVAGQSLFDYMPEAILAISALFIIAEMLLTLSLIKHLKNRTLIKHTLLYFLIHKLALFTGEVYANGNNAVKMVLLVIGYPLLVIATFFMFPVTLGIAAWYTLKKLKIFQEIQEGVEQVKDGNLQHQIETDGKGEFGRLAANINRITDGLKNAVNSELKSERLKTELITNVSHDIRTPLTSIITYVDLLKQENDSVKAQEYIQVLEQKSHRLKDLTDDLFEATKASSGTMPVHLDKIDIASLLNQGLGEVNDKITEMDLDMKMIYPEEKVFVAADGKLLWRAIENLLSNIFKYSLVGSRVYLSVEEHENDILITIKNISAYELNITADELMERFKRGDESRTSQGSGLGLSITKSLIELQNGSFEIEIDGDLFKAMIYLPKH